MFINVIKTRVISILILTAALAVGPAKLASAYDMAVGPNDGPAYGLGVVLSSLIKVKLLPTERIDLNTVVTDNDEASLDALESGRVTFALAAIDTASLQSNPSIAMVAVLYSNSARPVTLLTSPDADDLLIESVLEAIFDNMDFLTRSSEQVLSVSAQAARLNANANVPLHDAAARYYGPPSLAQRPAPSTIVPAATTRSLSKPDAELPDAQREDARNFVLYFDFDDASLNQAAQSVLRDAAEFATSLDSPTILVAAYTDSMGNAEYNYYLAERRAKAVKEGFTSLNINVEALQTSLFGERSLWTLTPDDVGEANNRRVELFIEEPVEPIRLLPIGDDG